MGRTIETVWEVWSYDVWGNEEDGYEVNDRYNIDREYPIRCRVETFNVGTPQQFDSATPTDSNIRKALSLKPRIRIETDGDDTHIYVSKDGYPLGELLCTSHESLSPPRKSK